MYLVGAAHPNKTRSHEILTRLIAGQERLATSIEVFQEILHRYTAIRRHEAIRPAWAALAGVVDEIFTPELEDIEQARDMVIEHANLSARDALHACVMRRHGVDRILTFDGGFDAVPGLTRIA